MNQTGRAKLEEKEFSVMKALEKAVPMMPEFRKGYLIGYGEAMAEKKEMDEQTKEEEAPAFAEEQ